MFGKLINGQLELAPRRLRFNGFIYYNPKPEILMEAGYKPVIYTDTPGPGYEESWVENEFEIIQIWIPAQEPEPEPDPE